MNQSLSEIQVLPMKKQSKQMLEASSPPGPAMLILRVLLALLAGVFLFWGTLTAQEQTGEIIGTIVLEDGSAIPGVVIEATGPNLIGKQTTVTNMVGAFRLMALPPGSYEVIYRLEGFRTGKRRNVPVGVGRIYKLDIMMETGGLFRSFCSCVPPRFDVRKNQTAVNIPKEQFKKLPKGRDFLSILSIVPGTRTVR